MGTFGSTTIPQEALKLFPIVGLKGTGKKGIHRRTKMAQAKAKVDE